MSPEEFSQLVVTYGADLSRWPVALQPAARSLLEATPELHRTLSEAMRLDTAISSQSAQISDMRIARLKAVALAKAQHFHPVRQDEAAESTHPLTSRTKRRVLERSWTWLAAGFAGAMCLLILVQGARPVDESQDSQSAIVALLEYDSGVLEMIR